LRNPRIGRYLECAVALVLFIVSALLIYHRGGGLAWLGLLLGAGLLVKAWRRPSARGPLIGLSIVTIWVLAWPAVFYYVISTWETGEVVELSIRTINGEHTARTWIMESPDSYILYYDAPKKVARALIANTELKISRDGVIADFVEYSARPVGTLSLQKREQVTDLMSSKYGNRNTSTDIYYGFLGQSKSKTGVLIEIPR